MKKVHLNQKGEQWRRSGHPWIFRNTLASADAHSGDIVAVLDAAGKCLGKGFYSAKSQIAVRVFTFDEIEVDEKFWRRRLDTAIDYRKKTVGEGNAYRVISSEADGIPGLIVDRYDDHLVLQTLCPAAERLKDFYVQELIERLQPVCIVERNDPNARLLEGLEKKVSILKGDMREDLVIREGSVRFHVDPLGGQKTGTYLDQRENHLCAAGYACGKVLDGFCYQGGFALHEAFGAKQVLAVDSSASAIAMAQKNAALNGLTNIEFRKAKVFDLLRDLKNETPFDLISIDPPAFAKSSKEIAGAERGYREINLRAMEILREGGYLITSSCSYHMTEERLLTVLKQAASKLGRLVRLVEKRTQAKDHPILLTMPESHYLKCLILQIL